VEICTNSLSSWLTPIIAIVAVYIAYQQYKTNSNRELRESKQEKLSVYKRVKLFLNSVDTTREISDKVYIELDEAIAEADFLFEEELTDWLSDLQSYADEFRNCENHLVSLKVKNKMLTSSIEELRKVEPDACKYYENLQEQMIDNLQNAHCVLKPKFSNYFKFGV